MGTMNVLRRMGDSVAQLDAAYGAAWVWTTFALSALVALGYAAIAVNWYFQSKIPGRTEPKAALRRLRVITAACAGCGFVLYAVEMPWIVWRAYDAVLIVLLAYTWSFVVRMRGWSLVGERLAQIEELERSAARYREIAELLPH